MNKMFSVFRGRPIADVLGLICVLALLLSNAFHFNLTSLYPYYREIFAIIFIVLLVPKLIKVSFSPNETKNIKKIVFYILIYPLLLLIWSLFDPGVNLYGFVKSEVVSKHISAVDPTVYILRNAVLYLPMVVYISVRKLQLSEIRLISLAGILVAPFSIFSYLNSRRGGVVAATLINAAKGDYVNLIAYNTYVPYLTFLLLCGIYLIFDSSRIITKVIVLPSVLITIIFCVLSTSRQSVLFIVCCFLVFLYYTGVSVKKIARLIVFAVCLFLAFYYSTRDITFHTKITERFTSIQGFFDSSQRGSLALSGLALLNPLQWITGAGLTSVIDSGPHNDYVRWTQRVGVPLMMVGFAPFFMAFRKSMLWLRTSPFLHKHTHVFLAMAVGFTIFHSLFAYPREESNQSLAAYLGLALWLGFYGNKI